MMIVAVGSGCSTVLMSTHLTDEAAVCDTIVVLDKGSVCFVGSSDALARAATGRTWVQADAAPTWARAFWRPADGRYRILGTNWHLLVLSSWSPRSRTGISRSWGCAVVGGGRASRRNVVGGHSGHNGSVRRIGRVLYSSLARARRGRLHRR
jgi:hypothetical protein